MRTTFPIPSEFTDEDKWFRYFTKKSLLALAISGMIAYGIIMLGKLLGGLIPAIIVGGLFVAIVTGCTMLPYPDTEYLKGGGMTLDVLFIRRIIRRSNKKLYVKGYSQWKDS